jgi:hypothetical protein
MAGRKFEASKIEAKDVVKTASAILGQIKDPNNSAKVTEYNKGVFPLPNGAEVTFEGFALQAWTLSAGKDNRGVEQPAKDGLTPVLVFKVAGNLIPVALGAFSKPKTGWIDGKLSYDCNPNEGLRSELASTGNYDSSMNAVEKFLKCKNGEKLVAKHQYVLSIDKSYSITVPNVVKEKPNK